MPVCLLPLNALTVYTVLLPRHLDCWHTAGRMRTSARAARCWTRAWSSWAPSASRGALTSTGILVLSSGDSDGRWIGPVDRILKAAILSPFVGQTLSSLDVKRSKQDLEELAALVEAGKLMPIIDCAHSLDQVPEAIRYVETGHARGKVVITL